MEEDKLKESKKILTDYMLELNDDIQRAEDWVNTGADEEMYFALQTVLNELERLQKENNDLRAIRETVRYIEEDGEKDDLYYVVGRGSYLANVLENAQDFEKTVHTCLHCGENTPLYCEKCQQELITKNAELQSDNYEIKNTYRRTAQHLNNIGKTELADYMLAQINDVPVWCVGDDKNFIPKQVIRDKFKRINETKIKINKTNARDYMIFSNTERATGWFINIDYIEKILLDVPGYKIGDE